MNTTNLKRVFVNFASQLQNRDTNLEITEDTVRMYLYKCMLDEDNDLNHYILELPYESKRTSLGIKKNLLKKASNNGSHQELDLFYNDEKNKFAFEIKFHRKGTSSSNKTEKAGAIFNDLNRLNIINGKGIEKYFVYVTDDEMMNYFLHNKNNKGPRCAKLNKAAKDIFDECKTESYKIPYDNQYKRFFSKAWESFNQNSADIKLELTLTLSSQKDDQKDNYCIKIYKVI